MLLEAAARSGDPAIEIEAVGRLLGSFPAEQQAVGLYSGERYAIQIHVEARTPADALFTASAGWTDAVRRLALPTWALARAEVMTLEEFAAEVAAHGEQELVTAESLPEHDPPGTDGGARPGLA